MVVTPNTVQLEYKVVCDIWQPSKLYLSLKNWKIKETNTSDTLLRLFENNVLSNDNWEMFFSMF